MKKGNTQNIIIIILLLLIAGSAYFFPRMDRPPVVDHSEENARLSARNKELLSREGLRRTKYLVDSISHYREVDSLVGINARLNKRLAAVPSLITASPEEIDSIGLALFPVVHTDTLIKINLDRARYAFAETMRSRVKDSILVLYENRIVHAEQYTDSMRADLSAIIKTKEDKSANDEVIKTNLTADKDAAQEATRTANQQKKKTKIVAVGLGILSVLEAIALSFSATH